MKSRLPADPLEVFRSGSETLVSEGELREKLAQGRPLRIKYGCDPSAPDLHLGHVVPLTKLRELQDAGHTIVFLVGDFTARIGDPTGRSRTRPPLSRDDVRRNAETYCDQVGAVLDAKSIEIRFNSEWMDAMSPADLVRLMSQQTVAQLLEREDFKTRFEGGTPIALHELLYPLVQAYDSVVLEADVEVGGTDQLFNLLLGREIQRAHGQSPQVVLTLPLLVGTDGVEKMSKSLGNAIGIREAPNEIFGKVMSIPDELLESWLDLLVAPEVGLDELRARVSAGEANPRDLKSQLSRHLVERFHGPAAAAEAERHFDRVFRQHKPPEELPELTISGCGAKGALLVDVLIAADFAASRSEARRLVQQGGVRIDEERWTEPERALGPGSYILQVGKRRFARVRVAPAG